MGTNHKNFILTVNDYTQKSLESSSNRMNNKVPVFFHPNFEKIDKHFSESTIWSGFLGCLWKGKSLPLKISNSKAQSIDHFVRYNRLRNSELYSYDDNLLITYLNNSLKENSQLSFDDQLSFFQRQSKYTFNYVSFKGQKKVLFPLLEKENIGFWLSIDHESQRQKSKLLISIMERYFPELYRVPNTEIFGAAESDNYFSKKVKKFSFKLRNRLSSFYAGIDPSQISYINFRKSFHNSEKFREIIKQNLSNLSDRKVMGDWFMSRHNNLNWSTKLDIEKIFEDASKTKKKPIHDILNLVSLEIIMKNQ